MGDISIVFNNATGVGDFAMDGPSLLLGNDLQTAVLISMFTDAPATPDDNLPATFTANDRRGFWADAYLAEEDPLLAVIPGDVTGSKLWQIFLRPRNQDTLNWATNETLRCLNWMIIDGVASGITANAYFIGSAGVGIAVVITEPNGGQNPFSYAWSQEG